MKFHQGEAMLSAKKWALGLLALTFGMPLMAMETTMVSEGSLTGISGWDPTRRTEDNLKSAGGEIKLYLQPILAFKDKRWLITPNYDFEYSNVNNVLAVDDSVFLFNQYMSNLFELGGAWRNRGGQRAGLKGFYTAINGTTATNEKLSTGLYNYGDLGVKANWSLKTEAKSTYAVEVASYARKYPNYVTLDADQRHEKDSNIGSVSLDADIRWNTARPFMTLLNYSFQSQNYSDAYVIDETGTTITASGKSTLRKDIVHTLGLTLPFEFGPTKWGLGYTREARISNFNYYDSQQSIYMSGYNDYIEHGMILSFAYDFKDPWWFLISPEITLDADAHLRLYRTRMAKRSDGTYDDAPPLEKDNRYQARIGLNSPVSEHWSANASMDFLGVTSNNLDASTSLVNYKFYTLRAGAMFNY